MLQTMLRCNDTKSRYAGMVLTEQHLLTSILLSSYLHSPLYLHFQRYIGGGNEIHFLGTGWVNKIYSTGISLRGVGVL